MISTKPAISGSVRRVVMPLLVAGSVALALVGCAVAGPSAVANQSDVPAAAATPATVLDVDGTEREVVIHDVEPAVTGLRPALVLLHGAGGSAARMEGATAMVPIAADNGFVLAFGQGTTTGRPIGGGAWDAGRCCAAAVQNDVDDIAYLNAVIDELVDEHGVDPARVYLGGFSNGGMLSYRAACEIGTRLAGIVVVAGALNVDSCEAPVPLPVLVIHGTADATVPFEGGVPNPVTVSKLGSWTNASVADAVEFWSERDGCSGSEIAGESDTVTDTAYTGCVDGSALEVVAVTGGAHRWPTTETEGFDASPYIAAWFGLAS